MGEVRALRPLPPPLALVDAVAAVLDIALLVGTRDDDEHAAMRRVAVVLDRRCPRGEGRISWSDLVESSRLPE